MHSGDLLKIIIEVIKEFNKEGVIPNSFQIAKRVKEKGYKITIEQELPDGYNSPEVNASLFYLEMTGYIKRKRFQGYLL